MSQSFVNTNSFPLELGLGAQPIEAWAWPKITITFEPLKGYSRFLRVPGPQDGVGYRIARVGVLAGFRVKGLLSRGMPKF